MEANRGRRGFTFSHFDPIENPLNNYALAMANNNGFTINLSGNDVNHADRLADTNCGPVVSVLPIEYERRTERTPAGVALGKLASRVLYSATVSAHCLPAGVRSVLRSYLMGNTETTGPQFVSASRSAWFKSLPLKLIAVSYTHLTLPTN